MIPFTRNLIARASLLLLLVATLSGCILQNTIGRVEVTEDDILQQHVVNAAFRSGATVAACTRDGPTYGCFYVVDGEVVTSTLELLAEFGLLGALIDPLILQVPADVTAVTATFDDGNGAQPALVSTRASFEYEPGNAITAEPGTKFLILELPPSILATLPMTPPQNGPAFDFALNFEQRKPISQTVEPLQIKAMFTGKVTVNGHVYFVPLLPCVASFANVPTITIPISDTAVPLNMQLGDLIRQGQAVPCNNEAYNFSFVPPPFDEIIYLPSLNERHDVGASQSAPGEMTSTILLVNGEAFSSLFTLRVYNADGAEVYLTSQAISANGALTIPLPSSLGPAFRGSAVLESNRVLYAAVLNANADNSAREVYEATATPQTTLTFPLFQHAGASQSSRIAIQNTNNTASAEIILRYFNAKGIQVGTLARTIPPLGSTQFDSNDAAFGAPPFRYAVRVESAANILIAGSEHAQFTQDTAALRALTSADAGMTLDLNWIERRIKKSDNTPLNWSDIHVHNRGAQTTRVTMTYYASDGSARGSKSANVRANGVKRFSAKKFAALGDTFKGYARVTQNGNEPLAAIWLEVNKQGKNFYAFHGAPTERAASAWACLDARRVTTDPEQFTQFHILNADTKTAQLEIQLYHPTTGALLATVNNTLAAGAQLNLSTKKTAFSALDANYSGLALVRATNNAKLLVNTHVTFGGKGVTSHNCTGMP